MRLSPRFAALAPLIAALSAAVAPAAPITYIEAVNGDLIGSGAPLPILAFDVGVNTVTGVTSFSSDGVDPDSFAFTLPAGTRLVSATLTTEADSPFGDDNLTTVIWTFSAGSPDSNGGTLLENILVPGFPSTYTFTSVPQLGPDVFNVTAGQLLGPDSSSGGYTFSFVVQADRVLNPVPEPVSLAVFGGLVGVGGLIARRRKAA